MMKRVLYVFVFLMVVVALLFSGGCKKNNSTQYLLSALGDSSGTAATTFTYDLNGQVAMIYSNADLSGWDFYYNGSAISVRTYTSQGQVTTIDSFFYDTQNRLVQINDYSDTGKIKTSVFTYNGDNTVNSVSVTYTTGLNNELHNYTYTNGKLTERDDLVNVSGNFKLSSKYEFLAYDNHSNPFNNIGRIYLPDQFTLFAFVWCYPNNFTSAKLTYYDTSTGNPTSVDSNTGSYTYNSAGLPTKAIFYDGSNNTTYTYAYEQK